MVTCKYLGLYEHFSYLVIIKLVEKLIIKGLVIVLACVHMANGLLGLQKYVINKKWKKVKF